MLLRENSSEQMEYTECVVKRMTVAEYVVQCLVDCGVTHVFGGHGGAVVPLIDAICAHPKIEWVLTRCELNAALTAAAYAKMRGLDGLACCVGTSGPGASHLTTGVVEAVQDKLPVLFLTGLKKASHLGFSDFQDINQTEIFRAAGCAKSHSVAHKDQMIPLMRDCVATALTQCTAVHLAIPVDIQQAEIEAPLKLCSRKAGARVHNHFPCDEELTRLVDDLEKRRRDPNHKFIVAIGRRGIDAAKEIEAFAKLLQAPIVTTLDAKGAIPETNPLCVGCVGVFGNPGLEIPSKLIEHSKTVVSFGVDNHTALLVGTDSLQLRQHIEFDTDSSLIETRFSAVDTCIGPIPQTTARVVQLLAQRVGSTPPAAAIRLDDPAFHHFATPASYEAPPDELSEGYCHPGVVVSRLSRLLPDGAVVCLDVGDVTLWAALALCLSRPGQRVLASMRLGTMGYALCGALAAGALRPGAAVVAVAGDGGVQMSVNELATIQQAKVKCLILVMRNGVLGRVVNEDWGTSEPPQGCDLGNPDFVALARAYGGRGHRLDSSTDVEAIDAALRDGIGPTGGICLVEVVQDPNIKAGMYKTQEARIKKTAAAAAVAGQPGSGSTGGA